MQRVSLGDFELTYLSDGGYFADGGAIFGVVPKPLWERRIKPDEKNRLRLGMNSLLIRTGNQTILVETGAGPKLSEKEKEIYQPGEALLKSFEEARVAPDEVDIVINTHLHFDHCGWNTYYRDGKPVPTFPRAKYYVQRGEWNYANEQRERDRVSYISDNYNPLVESGQMQLLDGDQQVVPGVSVRVFPGHTRHMQAVIIESGGQRACYISDLIPTHAHLDLTWVMAYDLFPLETIESRKVFYKDAVPQKWLVIFTHDADMPWAYVEDKGRWKYAAAAL